MKKIILTVAAVFAFGFANAQDGDGAKFGIKAGLNMSNFSGDGEWDGKTGFYIGGLVELLYSMEGAEVDMGEFGNADYGVSYLRIPVMAKYYVMEGLNLQAGPQIAFKMGTAEDYADEAIKSMDFGVGVGAAYELPIGLFFDLRYNLGLSNISEDEDADVKNTAFQIGVGYRF